MKLSKSYLETISTKELISLAEFYGLFIPDGLPRHFIIAELLEFNEEEDVSWSMEDSETEEPRRLEIPSGYNCTEIHILLRDPIWIFAFWDFNNEEFKKICSKSGFKTFFLRVLIFDGEKPYSKPSGHYDIDIDSCDRSRYIHLSFEIITTKIELRYRCKNSEGLLAVSDFVTLSRKNIAENLCIADNKADEILNLSGLPFLKNLHFKNYRQAFR